MSPPGPLCYGGPCAGHICPEGQDCAGDRPARDPPRPKVRKSGPLSTRAQPVGYGLLLHWQGTCTKSPLGMVLGAGDTQMNTWEM